MRINIISSIIITLVLMLVCGIFRLDLFGFIILMIIVFGLMNNRKVMGKVRNFFGRFKIFGRSRVKSLRRASTESRKHRSKHALDRMKL